MDIPEQDRQALIEAARRRGQGGAAFGVYPSSGKRPEKLNVSRDVNMPAQTGRGWVAGTLGLLGDFEGVGRTLINLSPAGQEHERVTGKSFVSETPFFPTSDFYREWLPGYDPAPAAKFASGLGALTGGAGSTKLAGAAVKGAKATGKALGPKAAEMAEGYLQRSGLAPSVIKPKGGNWLSGNVERATERLKTIQLDESNNLITPESVTPEMVSRNPDLAVNNWIDTKLNKYIRNEMGTPEDPVRKLAERGVTHMQNPPQPDSRGWVEVYRQDAGYPREGFGQSPLAKGWENVADEAIAAQSAGRLRGALAEFEGAKTTSDIHAGIDRTLVKERAKQLEDTFKDTPSKDLADELDLDFEVTDANRAKVIEDRARTEVEGYYRGNAEDMLGPHYRHKVGLEAYDVGTRGEDLSWLGKIPEDQPVYALKSSDEQTLGFDHLIDELRNATRADSDLPANLRWKPEDLKKVTMEQAVERVSKINDWRAAQMEAARKAARDGIPVHKEYKGGFQWMAAPDTAANPKALQYIQDVGCESGWCTQGESLAREYGGGGNQLYVLHDPDGKSVVQISVKPGRPWNQRSGIFYDNPELEAPWATFSREVNAAAREKGVDRDPRYILGFPDWLAKNQPEVFEKYKGVFQESPREIVEIKGRQNRPPKEEHLPMVQDFVRSGNWSRVGDFANTGLYSADDVVTFMPKSFEMSRNARQLAIGRARQAGDLPKYMTMGEYEQILKKYAPEDIWKDKEPGYAKGGLVQDTDAIVAKLTSSGMDKDKALTQALRMANAKQEAHMAAGGLAALVKGSKAAKASTKAHPTVFPPAAPLTKAEMRPIAQRVASQMTGEFVRPNPKLSINPAGKANKTFEREKTLPVEVVRRIEQKPAPYVNYEELKDAYIAGVPGDPSLGGVAKPGSLSEVHEGAEELRRLGDVDFEKSETGPVQLFGGSRYGAYANDRNFWASNLGPARAIQNTVDELGLLGPVYGQYIKMSPESTNFALHNLDALLAYQQPEKLNKTKMEILNQEIRKGSPKYGKFPGFAGFEDPIDVLLQAQLHSDLRKHIAETLMKPKLTGSLGLRPGSDVLFGISEPSLRNLETGVSGYSVGKMEPGKDLTLSLHPTYDYDIPGSFIGQSRYPTPYEIAFPTSTAYTRANLKPGAQEFNTLKMIGAREKIDPQYIDQIKMYEELMKEYTGKKKGGLVKKSGLSVLNKAII